MNKLLTAGVILAVLLGGVALLKPQAVREVVKFGALSGPDIASPYLAISGVRYEYRSKDLGTSTSTPCSFQSPASTSTLSFASATIKVSSTTATTWTVAKATTPYATTTKLGKFAIGSGVQATMVASTTRPSTGLEELLEDDILVFGPNQYLVWGLAGLNDAFDATKLTGQCKAEFIVTSE